MRRAALLAALVLAAASSSAQEGPRPEPEVRAPRVTRWTIGGAIGFGFGSVNFVSIAPEVGYFVTDRLWTGISGRLQLTSDHRSSPTFDSTDYGFGAFARYFVVDRLYASVAWSQTSYELRTGVSSSARSSISALLVGGGYGAPLGGSGIVLLEVLYDVTGEAEGLYGTPFVFRTGVVFGF